MFILSIYFFILSFNDSVKKVFESKYLFFVYTLFSKIEYLVPVDINPLDMLKCTTYKTLKCKKSHYFDKCSAIFPAIGNRDVLVPSPGSAQKVAVFVL